MITRRRFLWAGSLATGAILMERLLQLQANRGALGDLHLGEPSRSGSSTQPIDGDMAGDALVSGQVVASGGGPVGNSRVTLFTSALTYFREARTDQAGQYNIANVPPGAYQLGACGLGREYQEISVQVSEPGIERSFTLGPDIHPGSWEVVGDTSPERFGGTNTGSLMSNGRIFYCHDTQDPVVFDPVTRAKYFPRQSSSEQGCHMPTLLIDGRLLLVGGGEVDDNGNFNNIAVKRVRAFDPYSGVWENWPDLNELRWYPGLARLADGRLLLFGGGQQPQRIRTETCEILDPQTRQSTPTGSLLRAGGFGPAMLLYTGEVLLTWEPPQLYNPQTGQWRLAGAFVQPNRGTNGGPPAIGDHPDHTAIFLPDGRVVAIGIRCTALGNPGSMVEIYDPATGNWSLRGSPDTIRSMPEALMLPTGKILVAGGRKEDDARPDPVNQWGQLKRVDMYDPVDDNWQRMADMADFREYHAVTLLVPDGRVLTTAGTRQPGLNPPPGSNTNIEAFSPPYLFRGVRPRIDSLSSTSLGHGASFNMDVSLTGAVTGVVLIGMNAISHWMDGGVPRLLRLPFTQQGGRVTAQVPSDMLVAPVGFYLLFALVDDIPSVGRIVRVSDANPEPTPTPCISAFADVPPNHPFYPYVHWMACQGYINGYPCGGPGEPCDPNQSPYFRPGANVTRGQLVKMVANTAGWPLITPSNPTFADVAADHPFFAYIETAASRSVITGYPCGGPGEPCDPQSRPYFRPGASITRGQLAKVVTLARDWSIPLPSNPTFSDVDVDHTFFRYVEAVAAYGVVDGYPCGGQGEPCDPQNRRYFRPGYSATRGQVAKVVTLAFGGP